MMSLTDAMENSETFIDVLDTNDGVRYKKLFKMDEDELMVSLDHGRTFVPAFDEFDGAALHSRVYVTLQDLPLYLKTTFLEM